MNENNYNLYFNLQILSKNYVLARKVPADLKSLNFPALLCCTSLNSRTNIDTNMICISSCKL